MSEKVLSEKELNESIFKLAAKSTGRASVRLLAVVGIVAGIVAAAYVLTALAGVIFVVWFLNNYGSDSGGSGSSGSFDNSSRSDSDDRAFRKWARYISRH